MPFSFVVSYPTYRDVFANPKGFNLSTKKITISTAGILPKIKKYISEKHKYKLAISLNAPNDKLRNIIMPINKTIKLIERTAKLKLKGVRRI